MKKVVSTPGIWQLDFSVDAQGIRSWCKRGGLPKPNQRHFCPRISPLYSHAVEMCVENLTFSEFCAIHFPIAVVNFLDLIDCANVPRRQHFTDG